MCLTCLSNKNSPAPVAYLGLHLSLLAGVVYYCPTIISFHEHPEVFAFWLDTVITLYLYFATHLRNPGYVEQDELYFTERPYPTIKAGTPMKKTNDSLAINNANSKKSSGKSKKKNLTAELEMEARIADLNKNYMRKIQEPDHGASSVSTNSVMITNIPTEILPHSDKKPSVDEHSMYGNQGINYQEEQSKSAIREEKINEDMVDCEPSMDVGEESMHQQHGINFDVKSNDDIDALDGSVTPGKNYSLKQEENKNNHINSNPAMFEGSRQEERGEIDERQGERQEEVSDQDRTRELHHEQQNMYNDLRKQRTKSRNQKEAEKADKPSNINDNNENAGVVKIDIKKGSLYKFNEESLTVPHSSGTTPHATFSAVEMSSPLARHLDPNHEYELMKSTERRLISRTETDNTYVEDDKKEKSKKKKKKGLTKKSDKKDQNIEVIQKLDEAPEMEDLEKQQEVKEDLILYVERRYCTKCGLEQPIRAKHCKDCERCVSQYDHHCPWLGNCIGERNHNLFYWYLTFQLVEAIWGEFKVLEYMFTKTYHDWASENAVRITLALVLAFFIIMIASLLSFHTYLACVNLTTWESLSWYKISYLREWHEDWGSPFSEGTLKNLKFFCCSSKSELRRWEMPKYKRPLDDQELSHEQ